MAPYTCTTALPTPLRRFTLFTMAPYTCATILPLHDGSLLHLSCFCLRRHIYDGSLHLYNDSPSSQCVVDNVTGIQHLHMFLWLSSNVDHQVYL
jgi:hypothetical protein